MKLQLTPHMLRLRLAEEELQTFAQAGQLSQVLHLGSHSFGYALRQLPPEAPASGLAVRHEAGQLVVEVPAALARQLIEGNTVSLKGEVIGTDEQRIRIVVEKDLGPSH